MNNRIRLFSVLLLFAFLKVQAVDDTLIRAGSVWKYLDNGTNQNTAWRSSAFNDAAWPSGPAELGYGDGDEATTLNYGPDANAKYITTYFRKTFSVSNLSNYNSFILKTIRDDGAVVYVNGVEVYRMNMPAGNITYTTPATAAIGNADEYTWQTAILNPSLFVTGTNLIAIEMHQSSGTSSDISFNLMLMGSPQFIPDTLVRAGTTWKYLDNGTNQDTAWRASSFNDASWAAGPAELGYGDGDEATALSYGPDANAKYITTYFRKTFSIANISNYNSFILQMIRDDGAVVYVNGMEAYRSNMPSGNITSATLATASIGNADEYAWQTASLNPSLFVTGNNLIAVEIHQNLATSSDISFNLMLIASPHLTPVTLSRGPYLQMLTPESVNIRWTTDVETDSRVQYGTDTTYGFTSDSSKITADHEMKISGLQPNTTYYYSVGSATLKLQGDTTNHFKTSTPSGSSAPFRVWVTGDFGTGTANQRAVKTSYINYAKNNPADFWLWLGDNAYSSGLATEYQNNVFAVYPEIMKNTPIYPCLGNHDYANTGYQSAAALGSDFPYFDLFTCPGNAEAGGVPSGTEKYYSFDYGNTHFIILDSYGSLNSGGTPMYDWLQSDLAANNKMWTICCWHHAPYTKGTHDSDTETELIDMRENILPLLETYHVDLVLGGHSHVYERSYLLKGHYGVETTLTPAMILDSGSVASPVFVKSAAENFDGTIYAVVGNSGQGGSVAVKSGWPHNAMSSYSNSLLGSMVLEVNNDTLSAQFLTSTGSVYDQFRMVKNIITASPDAGETNKVGEMKAFPNPSTDYVTIQYFSDVTGPVAVEICDLYGRKIYSGTKEAGSGLRTLTLDKEQLGDKTGLFLLKVRSSSGLMTKMIERIR